MSSRQLERSPPRGDASARELSCSESQFLLSRFEREVAVTGKPLRHSVNHLRELFGLAWAA